jgi:hypothetical protein
MNRLRALGRWFASQGPIILAMLLLGGAAFLGALTSFLDEVEEGQRGEELRHQLNRAEFELECRFDISVPVQEAQAAVQDAVNEKLDALSAGLVAVEAEDAAGVAEQVERIRQARIVEQENRVVLQEALADRATAVETCNGQAEELYG